MTAFQPNGTTGVAIAMKRMLARLIVLPLVLCALPLAAQAQSAAEKHPILIVVPFPAGGNVDVLARLLGAKLAERWNRTVEVGAVPGGNTGTDLVARSVPNGLTLLMGHVTSERVFRDPPYEPLKHFAPVGILASSPYVLLVNPSVPAQSIAELIAFAKTNKGAAKSGSSGNFSPSHLSAVLFRNMAGIEMEQVLFTGNPPAMAALMKGEIAMLVTGMPASLKHIQSGKVRALAVTTAKRSAALPEVPTMSEAGLTGYVYDPWYGLLAPVGTPQPAIARLNREMNEILRLPEMRAQLTEQGFEPLGGTPEEFAATIRADIKKWRAVLKGS